MIRRLLPFHAVLTVLLVLFLSPSWAQDQDRPGPATAPGEKSAEAQPEKKAEPVAAEPDKTTDSGAAQPEKKEEPAATEPVEKTGTLAVPAEKNATPESASHSATETPPAKEPGGRIYIIRQGDTLWAISNAFLKDPFLWPFIWKANPSVTNADLIYPGNKLTIPNLAPIERAMQEPEQAEKTEVAAEPKPKEVQSAPTGSKPAEAAEETPAPSRLILPEEKPLPILDKYSMLAAGFVDDEESSDRIVGSLEEKTIFGYDDILYVRIKSNKDAAVGDKFIIYDALNKVKHPVTGRVYGRLIKICGVLELTKKGKGDTFEARIIYSSDYADKDSLLTPFQEPTLIYQTAATKQKDLSGYVLEVMDGRTINAQIDVLYLDKGSEDGVDPGDRFLVYDRAKNGKYPRTSLGEAQVITARKRTATAIIRKSTNTIAKGDVIEFRNP